MKVMLCIFALLLWDLDCISQSILAWGANRHGQLGIGRDVSYEVPVKVSNISNIVKIFAGAMHSFAMDKEGRVFGWGYNKFGQLGDGTTISKNLPQEFYSLKT